MRGAGGMCPPLGLGLYTAVVQQRLFALCPAALGAVGVALGSVAVLLVAAEPHARPAVLRDEQSHQEGEQHGARPEQERRAGDDGTLNGVQRNQRGLGCVCWWKCRCHGACIKGFLPPSFTTSNGGWKRTTEDTHYVHLKRVVLK